MTLLGVASLVPWLGLLLMSAMIFDSGVTKGAVAFVWTLGLYGPITVIALVGGWIAFARRHARVSIAFALVPLVWFGVFVFVAVFVMPQK